MKIKLDLRFVWITSQVLVLLASCTNASVPAPTSTLPMPTVVSTLPMAGTEPLPTAVAPTAASITADLVLWAPVSANPDLAANLAQQLGAYAAANNLSLEIRQQISAQEFAGQVKLVVALASASEVSSLAASVPSVKFLAVGVPDVSATGNVSVIVENSVSVEDRAFMAGYLLALITDDYRVGVISQAGTEDGTKTQESFVVGAQFYCGLCNSRYGPILYYPKSAQIADPASQADWQAAADLLLTNSVTSVFIQPEVSSPALVSYLEAAGVRLLGIPGQAGLAEGGAWVGVIGSDLTSAVIGVVGRLLAGEEVSLVSAGLELTWVNQDFISEGRQGLFERTLQDLEAGLIRTTPVK
ncbi:MAG: hypothetical protein WA116_00790 [Anaerolineaceae bacterium]